MNDFIDWKPRVLLNAAQMPAFGDIVLYQGDYVDLYIDFLDANGDPVALDAFTIASQIKKDYLDPNPVDFDCSTTATVGRVRLQLLSDAGLTLQPGVYIWDFQITDPDGNRRTLLTGNVTIITEVTKV